MAEPDVPRRPVLVLGSASPARSALLRAAGITPVVRHSRVDEDALLAASGALITDPPALTLMLATAKARDVAEQVRADQVPGVPPGARVLVVGADSMLDFDGQVLGKARSAQEVRDRWAAMSGQAGVLVTGHVVIDLTSGRLVERAVATTIHFGRPDPIELEAYIDSGEPLAVAGSCTIDGLGGAFIEGVEGDHSNVIGLALPTLRALLAELGVRWTDLWDSV
ncbi:MAG TPA: nucleoside triphosphate pyrophosphatase [Motilibacterales bacterium]|nr:nucleoside triphosphate pyrophosphatase [Motilibacterales bacterium]